MEATESMGLKVDWINKVIWRILKTRDHHRLVLTTKSIRERMKDM